MAIDWIAGTALVVGIGSLALTWQSTRSAKKSIDTSIQIYEKQKQDEENRKKEIISGYKNLISKEIYCNRQWYEQWMKLFDAINSDGSVKIVNVLGKSHIEFIIDGKVDGIIPFKFHVNYTDSIISEIATLDTELFFEILSLKNEINFLNEMLECIILLLKNNQSITNLILHVHERFKKFGEIMNKIEGLCSDEK
ncbi:hypothetical protein [Morganella morganii]|uniref:hypothetical protein n=1 Tax=Morganella morganii TaxID=582 RepID=UPI003EBF3520